MTEQLLICFIAINFIIAAYLVGKERSEDDKK